MDLVIGSVRSADQKNGACAYHDQSWESCCIKVMSASEEANSNPDDMQHTCHGQKPGDEENLVTGIGYVVGVGVSVPNPAQCHDGKRSGSARSYLRNHDAAEQEQEHLNPGLQHR